MRRARARWVAPPIVAVLGLSLVACGGNAGAGQRIDLARAGCPSDIRVLTDSSPRVEQAALYRLLGDDLAVDVEARSVSGSLVVRGEPTGVDLTIVSNEEFGEVDTLQRLYDDPGLLLAAVDSDIAIVDAVRFPVVALFAPLERDPQVIVWDPQSFPNALTIAEVGVSFGENGLPMSVLSAPGNLAFEFLVGSGLLTVDQPVPTYTGVTDPFVAADGQVAQQGELTTDPRRLQLRADWDRPVRYETIEDAGYPRYASLLSARPGDVTRYADCFRELVPILQQATVDFLDEPAPTTEVIVAVATALGDSPDYDLKAATRAAALLRDEELMDNGANETIGDINGGRMQLLFDIAVPVFEELGYDIPRGLTPGDIATNAFIDPSIGD